MLFMKKIHIFWSTVCHKKVMTFNEKDLVAVDEEVQTKALKGYYDDRWGQSFRVILAFLHEQTFHHTMPTGKLIKANPP